MEIIIDTLAFVLGFDRYLGQLTATYGVFVYAFLFFIVFAETGFVITPLLPGDSLLFAAGAISSLGTLNIFLVWFLLTLAAILGDSINYWVGNLIGPKVFRQEKGLLFNKRHLVRTHNFYQKYGAKTIIIARFVPIVRTFAPFVAGIGRMTYPKFLAYNVIGGALWVSTFVIGGYFFGNLPVVKERIGLIIIVIIVLSAVPLVFEVVRKK